LVVAVDEGVNNDLGLATLAAHLAGPLHRPVVEPSGNPRHGRSHPDSHLAPLGLAVGPPIADRQPVLRENQPAVGPGVEARLDQVVPHLGQGAVGEPDHRRVVGREQPEDRLGITGLRSPDSAPVRQYDAGLHT
jgi:hypothetical protein